MNDENLFPDYEPKNTPDTAHDYLKKTDSFVFKILKELEKYKLETLKLILKYFNEYKIKAKKNPGVIQQGNVILGSNLDQYYPSEEEIIVSELGKMILNIVNLNSKEEIDDYKKKHGIKSQTIIYNEVKFRHVDVMGSGRFFFAEKNQAPITLKI